LAQLAQMTNQLYRFDFTLWGAADKNHIDVCRQLALHCKKWVFQLERGEEKKGLHFQGRVSLAKKYRLTEVPEVFKDTVMQGAHWSPTHVTGKAAWSYVMKEATRVEGPWSDETDWRTREEPTEIIGKELRPWQKTVVDMIKDEKENTRGINVIIDYAGSQGKGFLRKYLWYHKLAQLIPAATEVKNIMAFALKWPSRAYMIDIPKDPRATARSRTDMWRGLETLKDGIAVEFRYSPQMIQMKTAPHVWVFTNEKPALEAYTPDRWILWCICPKEHKLIPYTETRARNIEAHIRAERTKAAEAAAKKTPEKSIWD